MAADRQDARSAAQPRCDLPADPPAPDTPKPRSEKSNKPDPAPFQAGNGSTTPKEREERHACEQGLGGTASSTSGNARTRPGAVPESAQVDPLDPARKRSAAQGHEKARIAWDRAYDDAMAWRDWATWEILLEERESAEWYTPDVIEEDE